MLSCTVVTEDILSAIRVGRVAHAVAILGTEMTSEKVAALIKAANGREIIIWTDSDLAGRKGLRLFARRLSLLAIPWKPLRSTLDPKCFTDAQIFGALSLTKGDFAAID